MKLYKNVNLLFNNIDKSIILKKLFLNRNKFYHPVHFEEQKIINFKYKNSKILLDFKEIINNKNQNIQKWNLISQKYLELTKTIFSCSELLQKYIQKKKLFEKFKRNIFFRDNLKFFEDYTFVIFEIFKDGNLDFENFRELYPLSKNIFFKIILKKDFEKYEKNLDKNKCMLYSFTDYFKDIYKISKLKKTIKNEKRKRYQLIKFNSLFISIISEIKYIYKFEEWFNKEIISNNFQKIKLRIFEENIPKLQDNFQKIGLILEKDISESDPVYLNPENLENFIYVSYKNLNPHELNINLVINLFFIFLNCFIFGDFGYGLLLFFSSYSPIFLKFFNKNLLRVSGIFTMFSGIFFFDEFFSIPNIFSKLYPTLSFIPIIHKTKDFFLILKICLYFGFFSIIFFNFLGIINHLIIFFKFKKFNETILKNFLNILIYVNFFIGYFWNLKFFFIINLFLIFFYFLQFGFLSFISILKLIINFISFSRIGGLLISKAILGNLLISFILKFSKFFFLLQSLYFFL